MESNLEDVKSALQSHSGELSDRELKTKPSEISESDIGREKPKIPVYVGTKIVQATPMTQEEFLKKQGKWQEGQETYGDGYLVKYEDGYESWSPRDVFERCYRLLSASEILMLY